MLFGVAYALLRSYTVYYVRTLQTINVYYISWLFTIIHFKSAIINVCFLPLDKFGFFGIL